MKENLKQGWEKKWRASTEYNRFIWGPVRAFKKSIKDKQRYCIRIIKKMVWGWK